MVIFACQIQGDLRENRSLSQSGRAGCSDPGPADSQRRGAVIDGNYWRLCYATVSKRLGVGRCQVLDIAAYPWISWEKWWKMQSKQNLMSSHGRLKFYPFEALTALSNKGFDVAWSSGSSAFNVEIRGWTWWRWGCRWWLPFFKPFKCFISSHPCLLLAYTCVLELFSCIALVLHPYIIHVMLRGLLNLSPSQHFIITNGLMLVPAKWSNSVSLSLALSIVIMVWLKDRKMILDVLSPYHERKSLELIGRMM